MKNDKEPEWQIIHKLFEPIISDAESEAMRTFLISIKSKSNLSIIWTKLKK